jgi:hypothetical protein
MIKQQAIMATRRRDKGKSLCSMFAPSSYGRDDADGGRGEGGIAQEAIDDDAGRAPSFFLTAGAGEAYADARRWSHPRRTVATTRTAEGGRATRRSRIDDNAGRAPSFFWTSGAGEADADARRRSHPRYLPRQRRNRRGRHPRRGARRRRSQRRGRWKGGAASRRRRDR